MCGHLQDIATRHVCFVLLLFPQERSKQWKKKVVHHATRTVGAEKWYNNWWWEKNVLFVGCAFLLISYWQCRYHCKRNIIIWVYDSLFDSYLSVGIVYVTCELFSKLGSRSKSNQHRKPAMLCISYWCILFMLTSSSKWLRA